MRLCPFLLVLGLGLGHSSLLLAQGTSGGSSAEELFRQGRAAAQAGDFATACDRFAASERLEPAPGTLLNIADCEVHLGTLLSAAEHFKLAASGFPKNDPRRNFVAGRVAEIERRLAHLKVHIAPTVPMEAKILRDGESFDRQLVDTSILSDPRSTTFVVSAPGFTDRPFHVSLADGQSTEITLDVGPPTSGSSAGHELRHASGSGPNGPPWRTIGFATGGVGLLGIVVGAVTGGLALHEASVVKAHCQIPSYDCDAEGVSAGSSGHTYSIVSTALFVAGAALTAGGVALVILNKPQAEPVTLGLAPYFGASGGGAFGTLTF